MNMIEKSDKNWQFYVYYPDDYDVYFELDRQLKIKYNDEVKSVYSGCDAYHDGKLKYI
ncbi:MAG: hypothetical protein JSR17_00970 [Proteobacteria bacterium]|nr:hypothetical protein [Pseudomonadota bacterium]